MSITRRAFAAGAVSSLTAPTLFAPHVARAATSARTFRVIRDGSDIGVHTITVSRSGDEVQVAIDIALRVKILGITAYRYEMENREVWRGGDLFSMNSKSNDDGDAAFARVKRVGDELEVEGSVWSGTVPGNSASTTYWSYDFLDRPLWISTADGDPLKVTCTKMGPSETPGPNGALATERWKVGGDMDIDLHYVDREWASVRFDAGGEDAIYVPEAMSPSMAAVWFA
ncbi:MAG: DUF6134 family protein [Pseudomonadota bacterium]